MAVGLLVLRHGSDERVGEADVGVERGLTVGVEAQRPVERRRPLRRARRMLDEEAGLQRVSTLDLGQVAREVPEPVVAEERPPGLDVERPDRSRRAATEARLRHQVVRVGRREVLTEARQHLRPIVDVLGLLVERARVLVRPVHADGELGKRRRVERVQQRVDVADRVDLVLARLLRPSGAGRAEKRDAARALLVAELEPAVEGRVGPDVPVHPQHLVVPRPVLHGLERVVVLVGAGRIARVRQREEVQQAPVSSG